MKTYVLLCLLLIGAITQKQLSLPVEPQTQRRLSLALKSLGQELQTFRTPLQNPIQLYNRVYEAAISIQAVRKQLGQMNNVVIGEGNMVKGSRNILVGNYDSIRGSNNFVFVDSFDGSANGALLIEKWKIILNKRESIKTNPSWAIFLINQEENRKYQRYMTKNRGFSYGSNLNKNLVLLIEDAPDEITNKISSGMTALPRQDLTGSFGSSSSMNNYPQNGVQSFGSSNIVVKPQTYDSITVKSNILVSSQPVKLQAPIPSVSPVFSSSNSLSKENTNNFVLSFSTSVPLSSFGYGSANQASNKPVQQVKNRQIFGSQISNWNVAQPALSNSQNTVILSGNQQQIPIQNPVNPYGNLRVEETPKRQMFNALNAQMRNNLNSRQLRAPQNILTFQQQPQSIYSQSFPPLSNNAYQNIGPVYSQFRGYN